MSITLRWLPWRQLMAISLVVGLGAALSACDDGPAEEAASDAGAAVDDAVEATGEALEDVGDAVGDAVEGAGDAVRRATD